MDVTRRSGFWPGGVILLHVQVQWSKEQRAKEPVDGRNRVGAAQVTESRETGRRAAGTGARAGNSRGRGRAFYQPGIYGRGGDSEVRDHSGGAVRRLPVARQVVRRLLTGRFRAHRRKRYVSLSRSRHLRRTARPGAAPAAVALYA